ncbi:MAG: sulfotransferase [Phycisphaeraceae bacterium]|nr:sulfotransferase [Phycisphaeraceae bacterium]
MSPKADPATLERETTWLIHNGRFEEAIRRARELVALRPDDPGAIVLLSSAEISAGKPADATRRLRRAVQRAPQDARLRRVLGSALRLEGRADEALEELARALELSPGDPTARAALADMQVLRGDAGAGLRTLEPIIQSGAWDANNAIVHALACEALGKPEQAIAPVQRMLHEPGLTHSTQVELRYRLGSLLDKCGQYDRAFAAFDEANRLQRIPHDPDAMERAIDEAIANWTPENLRTVARPAIDAQRAVLIVGMPRSGTSLVEQVLASHPQVFGGDERGLLTQIAAELDHPAVGCLPVVRSPLGLRRQSLARGAQRYLKLLDGLASGEPRVTDKMPTNFLHLGLVWAMLPGARVIACSRDPMDTCLSCYFQNFSPALSFAFDLRHLGRFHRAGERLMTHWRNVLDLPILDVAYEDMVEDQEAMARRLVEFIGLEWNDACLRFHETDRVQMTSSNQQVRRPIYRTSVRRHERYAAHLAALRAALGAG